MASHDRVERPAISHPQHNKLVGLLAEFETPEALLVAAERVRDAGFTRWDTHTPFPVHGIDEAMGIRMTKLPIVVFVFGLAGALTGLILQWYTNATGFEQFPAVPAFLQGYNYIISGKPFWSLPANIPIIFELTVLLASLCAGIGMLVANNLPLFYNPIFRSRRFQRATSDRFFVRIDADDPRFSPAETPRLLSGLGATAVERIEETPVVEKPPAIFTRAAIVLGIAALIPLAIIATARNSKTPKPRIHLLQDMDNQEKYKQQQANPLFADGRAMRPPVGATPEKPLGLTVARGELREDEHFYNGFRLGPDPATGQPAALFFEEFPAQVKLTADFLARGQNRFGIYCAPCHGLGGHGDGPVNNRAVELGGGWVTAVDLNDNERRGRAVGHLFNSITRGIRTMPPYGDQIPEIDRWAIVAYVRALQRSSGTALDDLTPQQRSELQAR